ncbi:MAG: phospho-N-acetylmuramoyl-pentapeptide-transferase [Eubacteriales bacterium]|nr:phospho-N-acetylmuramoyl-pentapeptide-transferase [Eubacteriales bacterium]
MQQVLVLCLMTFGFSLVVGYWLLPRIKAWGHGQQVREDGPKSHLSKSGTPTFGGLFFLLPMAAVWILRFIAQGQFDAFQVIFLLVFAYALVGFWDDYTKVMINKAGISVKQKALSLGLITLTFAYYFVYGRGVDPVYIRLFAGNQVTISGAYRLLYLVFIILYLFFISNSVNLSDGIDGLCSSLMLVATLTFAPVLYKLAGTEGLPLIAVILVLAGGAGAFLVFNHHPAKVFMGDTGSLALGVGLAAVALWAGIPWIMLLTGLVFVVEGLSSLLQVAYFKATHGKRIFRMAPLHHHFELGGWSENKIVICFSLVGLVAGLMALLLV